MQVQVIFIWMLWVSIDELVIVPRLDLLFCGVSLHLFFSSSISDGHFVPNVSFGPYIIECLRKHIPNVFFNCHLMTSYPEHMVENVAKAQGNQADLLCFTFHYEATEPRGKTQELIDLIKTNNMKVGLTVSPDTPVDAILKYADQIDLALIMVCVIVYLSSGLSEVAVPRRC
jgi:pentose-5-phosphate-3-epimerase